MSFAPGDEVLVRDDWPERHGPVHIRTPHFLRGRRGRIERRLGAFPNPEDLAFGRPAATRELYHVLFPGRDIWPDGSDELLVEIYEHWLTRP
jgi:nitrile hydratase subunit beta